MKKILSITLLALLSNLALADMNSPYKMAIIEGTQGAKDIRKGSYLKGIKDISAHSQQQDDEVKVALEMNLCVAYANLNNIQQANASCDKAIYLSQQTTTQDSLTQKLMALALNNRAIYKAQLTDFDGAFKDLVAALEIKKEAIIEANLLKLIQTQATQVQFKNIQLSKV